MTWMEQYSKRDKLLQRLIRGASHELIEEVYRRILTEKRWWMLPSPGAKSWQEILEQAIQEGVLTKEEATFLRQDLLNCGTGKRGWTF